MKYFFIAVLLLALPSHGQSKPSGLDITRIKETGLTQPQAEQVLRMVVAKSPYRHWLNTRYAYIENLDDKTRQTVPGFYMFRLAYDSPKARATAYAGPYLISQKTADVWDVGLSSDCKNLHFPALAALQTQVRKKTGTTLDDETDLRKKFDCFK